MNKLEKFFSFSWFSNPQRKQLLDLQVEEQRLKNELIKEEITLKKDELWGNELKRTDIKPYKNLFFNGNSLTVVLWSGDILTSDATSEKYEQVKLCYNEKEIKDLLFIPLEVKKSEEVETKEERQLITDNLAILRSNEDFEIRGNDVYLKGISLKLPAIVCASFIENLERQLAVSSSFRSNTTSCKIAKEKLLEQYQSLKMFWYWTALNPIESSRQDLLRFVKNNDIPLTKNGLMVTFRKVVKVDDSNTTFSDIISFEYFKKKKQKKSPSNYSIFNKVGEENYRVIRNDKICNIDGTNEIQGCLKDLYNNLGKLTNTHYTDNHTKTKKIVFGTVYKEDESKIDLNNQRDCSSGLHSGSITFGSYNAFGNTGAICLLNPSKVRSVPTSDTNKLRSSELFMVAPTDFSDYENIVKQGILLDFDTEYSNQSIEELQNALRDKSFNDLSCQENVPEINLKDVKNIVFLLKGRVKLIN